MILEVMTEDENGNEVDQDELNEWADTYGLTMPVLSDPVSATMWSYASGGSVGLPFIVLVDQGAVIDEIGNPTIAELDALVEN